MPPPPSIAPLRLSISHPAVPALALALLLAVAPAAAQQPALDAASQEAQQLFLEGREAVKKNDLAAAADKFRRSEELRAAPGTLLNLASVEEQMGKLVSALEHFEAALKMLPETDERTPVAKEGADRVRPRIPSLRIDRASGAPADMTLRLDGAPVAASTIGTYQLLNPGTYVVSTSAPGHEDRRYELKLNESVRTTIAVEPGKALVRALGPAAPPRPRINAAQGVGFTAIGVGLAGLGIGAVSGALALVEKGDAASACSNPARCTGSGLQAASTGEALAAVSTAAFVVGLVGAVTGVTLLVVGRDKGPPAASATLAPWVLPSGAGVGVLGRF
jgi:tetratricopeptide (TPR) repeat protein